MLEPYRYLMDNFVLENARKFTPKDFELKAETFSKHRKGKRQYLVLPFVMETRVFGDLFLVLLMSAL